MDLLERLTVAKIITVTPNTAIDMFVEAEGYAEKDNIQARSSYEFACGKGVNVAKAAASLGVPALCLGFVGRQSLGLFNAIDVAGLQADFTPVAGKTRSNITLFDASANRETHIRTAGFVVDDADCRKLIDKLAGSVSAGDYVIFSGSLPPGAPENLYRILIDLCRNNGALALLDSSGAALREGLQADPYLIKPNAQEFAELTGLNSTAERDIVTAAREIIAQGVSWVCLSRGAQGAMLVGADMTLAAHVKQLPGEVCSHVGCGDALLGGLVVAMLQKLELQDMVRMGVACGTVNLFNVEPGRLDVGLLPKIFQDCEIRSILDAESV